VIPKLETGIDHCHSSQLSYRTPCLFAVGPAQSQITESFIDRNDRVGLYQRGIGRGGTRPAAQYVYTHARSFGNSNRVLATQYHSQGVYSGAVLIDPGSLPHDTANRTTFQAVEVKNLPASSYIEFGYNPSFECTQRTEACKVAASAIDLTTPFYFAHETMSSTSGTVTIPALPGRVLYWRVVTSGTPGATQVMVN
jgi:hypothetical protein